MQLSALLEKLQDKFTKALVIASLLPLFCFVAVNGAIFAQFFPSFAGGVSACFQGGITKATLWGSVFIFALIIAAFVFSTLNLTLREILEGKRLPDWMKNRLRLSEAERFNRCAAVIDGARTIRRILAREADHWIQDLRTARQEGSRLHQQCHYLHTAAGDTLRDLLNELEGARQRYNLLALLGSGPTKLEEAVTLLEDILRNNNVSVTEKADKSNRAEVDDAIALDHDQVRLVQIIKDAQGMAEQAYIEAFNYREFNFSRFTVAPTRMGNLAESVRGYAQHRYGMNLDFVWTRFQKVLQDKSEFIGTLNDAKIQLDFMVSMFWLTALTTGFWVLAMPLLATTWPPLLCVWAVGYLLTRCWYYIGLQNYLVFADLLRSSVDLFRFELLHALKIAYPANSEVEHATWELLNSKLCYGNDVIVLYTDGA